MARINFTDTTEKELKKLAELEGFDNYEIYIENIILSMLVNKLTEVDVQGTKKKIEAIQKELNDKRRDILLELKEEKREGGD